MTTSPSWYDLLDVAPDASAEEIRDAWKAAIADLDPTDRRFRVHNQAAEVLLDPERRAAYDAELAAAQDAEEIPEDDESVPEPEAPATPAATAVDGAAEATPARRGGVPTWALAVLAVLTAASVVAAAWLWFEEPSDAAVEDSTQAAQSAAERAIGPVLSYDYRHLDEDRAAAQSYMTSDYQSKDYDPLFEVVKQNAPHTHTSVKAEVVASGIVRSSEDGNRVDVLLFVNRPTTNKKTSQPLVYKDQVTVTMEKVGDDWLVDDMVTSPVSR